MPVTIQNTKVCEGCFKEYKRRKNQHGNIWTRSKYCSRECYRAVVKRRTWPGVV